MSKQISLYITDQQADALETLKDKTGIKQSEAIRRALDEYIKRELKGDEK